MPTNKLRFVKRVINPNTLHSRQALILQQEWDLGHGEYEWRDVPVEDEQ